MNIKENKQIFNEKRQQSIESLEFLLFLEEICEKYARRDNNKIQKFLSFVLNKAFSEVEKTENYQTSLHDYVFWKSSKIYLENMKKFVSHECSASDFACNVYWLIRSDLNESKHLMKDFKEQSKLELDPKIFGFSTVISKFELLLEDFIPERTTELTDDELRQIVKDVLPNVQRYFTDEI